MYTLGINANNHEGAACLVQDGAVLAAASEARLWPHRAQPCAPTQAAACLPSRAITACLAQAGLTLHDVDHAASDLVLAAGPQWRSQWQQVGRQHAIDAAAYLASPFESCAVLATDCQGATGDTTYGVWQEGSYRRLATPGNAPSLARLYTRVARHLGFPGPAGQARVTALAAYGRPGFVGQFRDLVRYRGQRSLDLPNADLADLLGPPRAALAALEQRHIDIAHSLQRVLEDTTLDIANRLHAQSAQTRLSIAGHFAGNWALNASLRSRSGFHELWAQPAGVGEGVAIGAALLVDAAQRGQPPRSWSMDHVFLGPQFHEDEIEAVLRQSKLAYRRCFDIARDTAALLSQGKVVGWFQGRMEAGDDPLGARSILAAPTDPTMQDRLNDMTGRDDFLPVPAIVLAEAAADWFVGSGDLPCMQCSETLLPHLAHRIPAVRHVDGSARVHAVRREQHALLYDLVQAHGRMTGIPVLANLPFGMANEPVAARPRAALESFCSMPLDALAIGPFLLEKSSLTAWRGIP